jgi:hypothetical protein
MPLKLKHIALATVLAASAATAMAAPFAITHDGASIGFADLPGVNAGESYQLTLIFDNGGASTSSQTWGGQHLTCVIWRFNNARNATYVQPIDPGSAYFTWQGSARTNASGQLTVNFDMVREDAANTFTATGLPGLAAPVAWIADSTTDPIFHNVTDNTSVSASAAGVTMNAGYWSPPARVAGACDDTAYAAPPAPVPALGHAALALLGACIGALALWRKRRGA